MQETIYDYTPWLITGFVIAACLLFIWGIKYAFWLKTQRYLKCYLEIEGEREPCAAYLHKQELDNDLTDDLHTIYRFCLTILDNDNDTGEIKGKYLEARSDLSMQDLDNTRWLSMGHANFGYKFVDASIHFIKISDIVYDQRPCKQLNLPPIDFFELTKWIFCIGAPFVAGIIFSIVFFFIDQEYLLLISISNIICWILGPVISVLYYFKYRRHYFEGSSNYWIHASYQKEIVEPLFNVEYTKTIRNGNKETIEPGSKTKLNPGELIEVYYDPDINEESIKVSEYRDNQKHLVIHREEVDFLRFRELNYDYQTKLTSLMYDIAQLRVRYKNAIHERNIANQTLAEVISHDQKERNQIHDNLVTNIRLNEYNGEIFKRNVLHLRTREDWQELEETRRQSDNRIIEENTNDLLQAKQQQWIQIRENRNNRKRNNNNR